MSRHYKSSGIIEISRLDKDLGEFSATITNGITPHSVMEYFKHQYKKSDLTVLGKLVCDHLNDPALFYQLCWIVYHFAFTPSRFGKDEKSTRNWISIKHSQQELINCIHAPTIGESPEKIETIYAPSIVARKLKDINNEHSDQLLRKWWIYKIAPCSVDCMTYEHHQCRLSIAHESNIICFFENTDKIINVFSCSEEHLQGGQTPKSLGKLLNSEDESIAADRYRAFANLIQQRCKANTKNYNGNASIECTYYARIPFFYFANEQYNIKKYMTEAFIAFKSNNIASVANILHKIEPVIQICVSIINSHIAYAFGEEEGGRLERIRSISRVSHAVSTPLREVSSAINKIPSTLPQKRNLEYQISICRNIELFAREAVKSYCSNNPAANLFQYGSFDKFFTELDIQLESICNFLEDPNVSPAGHIGKFAKGTYMNLYELCKANLTIPNNVEYTTISWNKEHVYVMIDGLLSNALKYHSLNYKDRSLQSYSASNSTPYLKVYFTITTADHGQRIFLTVENDSLYDSNKMDDALKEADDLSRCDHVDWIGVSLLHIASQAMKYLPPKWEAIYSQPYVRLRAHGQIGLIWPNEE